MLIGELARRTSVSTRLLRHYEEQGLLVSSRGANGYRNYDDDAPMIVGQIRGLLRAGLPTSVIRDLLPCAQGKAPRLTPCPDLIAVLREAAADMRTRIDSLTANRDAVLRYLDAAEAPRWSRLVLALVVGLVS